ncbi:aminotransferase [Olsenella sp. Marseille-QA0557]|uniref:Aminotransferase n=1 Tax=Candidatus Coprovicinus avistercoris TaxID=2840754 RepID=A0A9D1HY01_9ACTN|nr:aminotransferase [Candidatus Coprovicinus avistercoris]
MPNTYANMSVDQLNQEISWLEDEVERLRGLNLSLDMSRGKPNPEQIDLSRPMLNTLTNVSDLTDKGVDAANYGCPDGLPSARALAAEILGVNPDNVLVVGSSSLEIMHSVITNAFVHGIGGNEPWCRQEKVKFLCPSPGYDRHFALTESFGIENIPIPMREDGPDMEMVRSLVELDPQVKGIWCVPKYQNPTGITFSDAVVEAFASLKPAASDFRIYWDNAYVVHDLVQPGDSLREIFSAVEDAGGKDLVYEFASTSKVTFAGSGMAWVAASDADIEELRRAFSVMRVCPNKLVQLMHVDYLGDLTNVRSHMALHAQILQPRFALVERKLTEGLGELDIATWTHPNGGYFVSFDGPQGSAKAIVKMAAELGVKLTSAGATWPGGNDPYDTNIRIAPTYPSLEELSKALDVFVVCARIVSARLALSAQTA